MLWLVSPPSFELASKRLTMTNLLCTRGSLNTTERKAYSDAVLCLQKLPARTPTSLVPGARSRFDDFLASHINQTLTIHYTVCFRLRTKSQR